MNTNATATELVTSEKTVITVNYCELLLLQFTISLSFTGLLRNCKLGNIYRNNSSYSFQRISCYSSMDDENYKHVQAVKELHDCRFDSCEVCLDNCQQHYLAE